MLWTLNGGPPEGLDNLSHNQALATQTLAPQVAPGPAEARKLVISGSCDQEPAGALLQPETVI